MRSTLPRSGQHSESDKGGPRGGLVLDQDSEVTFHDLRHRFGARLKRLVRRQPVACRSRDRVDSEGRGRRTWVRELARIIFARRGRRPEA